MYRGAEEDERDRRLRSRRARVRRRQAVAPDQSARRATTRRPASTPKRDHPRVPHGHRRHRASARASRSTASSQGDRVDVAGISKGHGFAGGIKRWNFSGGGASHGSMIHRQPGSNGDTNSGHTPPRQPPSGPLRRRPDHPPEPRSRPRRRRAQSAARARPGAGPEERSRHRAAVRQDEGERVMAQVIDAQGKVVREQETPAAFGGDVSTARPTRSSARSSASWRTRAPAPLRPRSATKCAAAAASRGGRRAPAAPARARSARRSGRTAAWCSARSRARTSQSLNKKERRAAMRRRARRQVPERRRHRARHRRRSTSPRPRRSRRCCSARPRRRRPARARWSCSRPTSWPTVGTLAAPRRRATSSRSR